MGAIQQRRQLLDDAPTLGFECTFGVDDVGAVRERILVAGGRILMEKFTISQVALQRLRRSRWEPGPGRRIRRVRRLGDSPTRVRTIGLRRENRSARRIPSGYSGMPDAIEDWVQRLQAD